jgi:hypothetical protein
MKVSIKEVMVDLKKIENVGLLISDADANRIINRKTRTKRGKSISKEKIADLSKPYKFNGTVYYPLTQSLDDCHHNNYMIGGSK